MCESCQEKSKVRHKEYDQSIRDKNAARFYSSKAWQLKSKEALVRDNHLCVHCYKKKKIKRAEMVDHVIPIKIDWSLRLTLRNLQSLCNKCHKAKTIEDKKRYG